MEKDLENNKENQNVNQNNFNRIAIAIMEKNNCSYDEALIKLQSLKLFIECNEEINNSVSLQSALFTAINTGKRSFLGGVYVKIKTNSPLLLNWPNIGTIKDGITTFGGKIVEEEIECDFKILFGIKPLYESEIKVICNGWIGGFVTHDQILDFEVHCNFEIPICGVMSAALAVGQSFLKVTGIDIFATESSMLISLWRPDLDWKDPNANGPVLEYLPKKFWLLGLGHLGQAYLWNISFLPYKNRNLITVLLQDFDKIVEANFSAGLLCNINSIDKYKTRVCSEWLEYLGFSTIICERKFNENTKRANEEPFVALAGFDNIDARKNLLKSNFDFTIDCGIGGALGNFDEFVIRTFLKNDNLLYSTFNSTVQTELFHVNVFNKFNVGEKCGILAIDLSKKAISTSFVGAFAGSFVITELIKGLNNGYRNTNMIISMRDCENRNISDIIKYSTDVLRNGFVNSDNC